ncbi:membrane hypothetical protein [Tenacibaculum maritimum]|nr:membrane hypothetical protein [Tenacibaculum maritimum]CAA0157579.1 membrane hypothetical protein [Tenacibaculum maritimum]CAA0158395.1 membrane hypothetical protein [Tenacibaculum maritimum]CAA0191230.1 membrane hypothetical protein [Tenacibaculum maritimum]CAA0208300.1 membrane hypothetical protein [Tenacibaculum maritimum]
MTSLQTSLFLSVMRFTLIGILFYFFSKNINQKKERLFSDFLAINISKYTSISVIIIFFLVHLENYAFFNYIFLIFIFFIFDIHNFVGPAQIYQSLKSNFDTLTLKAIGFIEEPHKWHSIKLYFSDKKLSQQETHDLLAVVFIIITALFSRVTFYTNDAYLFSEDWFYDLEKLLSISDQKWFNLDHTETGEFALVDLYSKTLKIGPEIALQTFGIIQTILLSVLAYWIVKKSNVKERLIIPIFTAIIFIGTVSISPSSIHFILKHHSILSVLSISFPLLILLTNNNPFYRSAKSIIIYTSLISTACFLISFSDFLIIFFPFLLFTILYNSEKKIKEKTVLTLSFLFPAICIIVSHFLLYEHEYFDPLFFIKNSFINASDFVKISDISTAYLTIIKWSIFFCFIGITSSFIRKNNILLLVSALYLFYILLYRVNHYLINENSLLLTFKIFTPIIIGLNLHNLISLIRTKAFKIKTIITYAAAFLCLVYLPSTQKGIFEDIKALNETNRQFLKIYNNITTEHLPYTYAVVGNGKMIDFSKNKHLFLNYHEFNTEYLQRDSIYHKNIKDDDFMKNNPSIILPNSIFLFEILGTDKNFNEALKITSSDQLKTNNHIITTLKKRGRKINLYTKTDKLIIYEIINKKSSSHINEMLFLDKRL